MAGFEAPWSTGSWFEICATGTTIRSRVAESGLFEPVAWIVSVSVPVAPETVCSDTRSNGLSCVSSIWKSAGLFVVLTVVLRPVLSSHRSAPLKSVT